MRTATVQVKAGILGRARKIAGTKSDEVFAAKLGVSRETLRQVENGERAPSNAFMAGLCVTTRLPLHELFKVAV